MLKIKKIYYFKLKKNFKKTTLSSVSNNEYMLKF